MLRCTAVAFLLLLACRPAPSVEPEPPAAVEPAPAEPTVASAEPPATAVLEPTVASEEPKVPEAEPEVPVTAISKDVIRTIVRSHLAGVKHCYNAALAVEPSLTGRVETNFTIGPVGTVIAVDLRAPEWPSSEVTRELQRCLGAEIESWTFPAPEGGGNVVIIYPFVFVPEADVPAGG